MSKKIFGIIVIGVIAYNVYDFIRTKNNRKDDDLKNCTSKFIQNTNVSKSVALKYCDCILESLGGKYEGSKLSSNEIREKEKIVLQNCLEQAVASESK